MAPSKRVHQQRKVLKSLTRIPNKSLPSVVKYLPDETIKAISEIAINILHGNIRSDKQSIHKLKKYRHTLRRIDKICQRKHINTNKLRKVITPQSGGFLPAILIAALKFLGKTAVGSAVGAIANKIFNNKKKK